MRAVFETLGMQDVVAKSIGSSNPYNMVRATFDALKHQDSPRSVAARRGIKVSALPGPPPRRWMSKPTADNARGVRSWQDSSKTITVEQIGSPIRRRGDQRATLIGLGLNKHRRALTLPDTPACAA